VRISCSNIGRLLSTSSIFTSKEMLHMENLDVKTFLIKNHDHG